MIPEFQTIPLQKNKIMNFAQKFYHDFPEKVQKINRSNNFGAKNHDKFFSEKKLQFSRLKSFLFNLDAEITIFAPKIFFSSFEI